ncbi:MAG: zf-HC2 domain-containing protein [Thermoleophilia bacterium]
MACDRWVEAISARADGEDPGVDERLLDAHLAGCPACRSFEALLGESTRRARVAEAPVVPDQARAVVALNAALDRASRPLVVRVLLAIAAGWIVALSAKPLVLGEQGGAYSHDARHLGAFSVAYAVALLVAAARPARARAILPVAVVLTGAILITALIDVVEGRIPLVHESVHLPELFSIVLVWLLATPPPAPVAGADGPPRLRAVASDGREPAAPSGEPTDADEPAGALVELSARVTVRPGPERPPTA